MTDLRQLAQAVVDELHGGYKCDKRSWGHQSALCKLRRYLESDDDGYWDVHDPFQAAQISQDSQTDLDG